MYNHVWGIVGKLLTPGSQQDGRTSGFPALISVRGADRYLEDVGPNIPRDGFFGKVVEGKVVKDDQLGWFKVFLDIQDHLGQAQGHRQPGVGGEQGRS